MSTLLLRAKQTTAKEKRCPAARRRDLRPQGAVPAGAAERPPGPACALHPGGGRRAAGSFPPGRLHGAGGRSRLPPTVLGQRSSQRGPDAIVCARGDEARHVFPSPWIELSPPQHGFPECGPRFNSSVSRGCRGKRERGPPSGLGQPCPRRWLQRLPEPSGMFLAAWPALQAGHTALKTPPRPRRLEQARRPSAGQAGSGTAPPQGVTPPHLTNGHRRGAQGVLCVRACVHASQLRARCG